MVVRNLPKSSPASTEKKLPASGPDINAQIGDAWNQAYDIARGLREWVYDASACSQGISHDHLWMMHLVADELVRKMEAVAVLFRPTRVQEGGING